MILQAESGPVRLWAAIPDIKSYLHFLLNLSASCNNNSGNRFLFFEQGICQFQLIVILTCGLEKPPFSRLVPIVNTCSFFDLMHKAPLTYVSSQDPILKQKVMTALEMATGRSLLAKRYRKLQDMDLESWEVWGKALEILDIEVKVEGVQIDEIPKQGPLILIANHPYGVVDGLIMGKIAAEVRTQFSILANAVLRGQDPRIEQNLLPVDFAETKEASLVNIATRRTAIEKLANGEAIVVFPGGGIATAPKVFGKAEELEWKNFTAQMIQKSKATVVPIFFHGQNSPLFHFASKMGPTFRLGLLLREVKRTMGKTVHLTIGTPISCEKLGKTKRQEMMGMLKGITLGLANEGTGKA